MNKFLQPLRIITALLAVITAGLLALWVLGVTDDEQTKEFIIKVALISGIAVVLSTVLQLLSGSDKK